MIELENDCPCRGRAPASFEGSVGSSATWLMMVWTAWLLLMHLAALKLVIAAGSAEGSREQARQLYGMAPASGTGVAVDDMRRESLDQELATCGRNAADA